MKTLILFLALLWAGTGASFAQEKETVRIGKETIAQEKETPRPVAAATEGDTVEIVLIQPDLYCGNLSNSKDPRPEAIAFNRQKCFCISTNDEYQKITEYSTNVQPGYKLPEIDFSQNTLIGYSNKGSVKKIKKLYYIKSKDEYVFFLSPHKMKDGSYLMPLVSDYGMYFKVVPSKIDCRKLRCHPILN